MNKLCKTCKIEKLLPADFYVSYETKKGVKVYSAECKDCNKKRTIAFNKKHKDKRRNIEYKHKYDISLEDYNKLLVDQDNVCKICKKNEGLRRLAVDHCHATGKIRGLLCASCNQGVGNFKDSIDLLEAARKYLCE